MQTGLQQIPEGQGRTCRLSGWGCPLSLSWGVWIPSLARGEVAPPPGDTSGDLSCALLAAAAVAVALVVLMGVVSCSLPKGVAGALCWAGLPVLSEGAVSTS